MGQYKEKMQEILWFVIWQTYQCGPFTSVKPASSASSSSCFHGCRGVPVPPALADFAGFALCRGEAVFSGSGVADAEVIFPWCCRLCTCWLEGGV